MDTNKVSETKSLPAIRLRPLPDREDCKLLEELVPQKLQAWNYVEWRKQMEDVIKRNGLLGFINGAVQCPPKTLTQVISIGRNGGSSNFLEKQNEKYVAWEKSDDRVRKWIGFRLTLRIWKEVDALRLPTAKEVWDALYQLDEKNKKRLHHYLPLYKAAIDGDWEIANDFVQKEPDAMEAAITVDSETALIVAVRAVQRNNFVKKLVEKMSGEQLAIGDVVGRTALHMAVRYGNISAAKLLVQRNKDLPNQETYEYDGKQTPLFYAAKRGDRKMILWLMERTKTELLEGDSGRKILYQLTISKNYDIAVTLLRAHRELASIISQKEENLKYHALTALAANPCSFPSGNDFNILERFIDFGMKLENNADHIERDEEAPPVNAADVEKRSKSKCGMLWKVAEKFGMKLEYNIADRSERDEEAPPANAADENKRPPPAPATSRRRSPSLPAADSRHHPPPSPTHVPSPPHSVPRSPPPLPHSAPPPPHLEKKRLKYEMLWRVAEKLVPKIKTIRENKMLHDQALTLLQLLCNEVTNSGFLNAARIFQPALERATSMGIPEIVEKIFESDPTAIHIESSKRQSIFQQAIVFRKEKPFNLIHQLGESKEVFLTRKDASGDHALFSAAKVVDPQLVYLNTCAAFQMQRELQWFKEVDSLTPSTIRDQRNDKEKTPAEVFTEAHKELVDEGAKWMKDTAESCIIIASLIATMVFTAAITVPGGSNNNGNPIFHQQRALVIFGITNGLALFSSIASVVMFLSILTSSMTQEDFLFTLPNRLIISLTHLYLSIIFSMGAFCSTIYLVFGENKGWILFPVVLLGCIPVLWSGFVQFPLLNRMVKSTYGPSIFGKQSGRMLL